MQAGHQAENCNNTIKDTDRQSSMLLGRRLGIRGGGREGGKKATWKAYSGIIPSCTLCMSSLVFEAFPHNKRIRHKRQIVRKEEALNQATYQVLQSFKRGKCRKRV